MNRKLSAVFLFTHNSLRFHCLIAARERLAAAHRHNAYRCFLPDLTKFTPGCCAGPLPDCKKTVNNKNSHGSNERDIIHIPCNALYFSISFFYFGVVRTDRWFGFPAMEVGAYAIIIRDPPSCKPLTWWQEKSSLSFVTHLVSTCSGLSYTRKLWGLQVTPRMFGEVFEGVGCREK